MKRVVLAVGTTLAATFSHAWCVPSGPEATQTNTFLANLTNGTYVQMAVTNIFGDIAPSIWNTLPIELAPLEEEVGRALARETQRSFRSLVKSGAGEMGLSGNLSLASCSSGQTRQQPRRVGSRKPLRLQASASRSRLSLSLLWSF